MAFFRKRSQWKWIPGYEGYYKIKLNPVRIKSMDCLVPNKGDTFSLRKGKILKQYKGTDNYLFVTLCKNGKRKRFSVHHLVLLTYVGPRPLGMVARHFPDRNPANCELENLSWSTEKQNQRDRIIHGTDYSGEVHWRCKLTTLQVKEIRKRLKNGTHKTQKELAKEYKVNSKTISLIKTNKTRKIH